MAVEIISLSISKKVWDRAGTKFVIPGSAVRLASVARHVTDCAMWPGKRDRWSVPTARSAFAKLKHVKE